MADFTNDERFDGLYLNVANTTRGIEPLLDTVFSFLRRKTDFFHGPNGQDPDAAIAKVNEVLDKHVKLYQAEMNKKQKAKEAQEAKAKAKKQKAEKKKQEKAKKAAAEASKQSKSEGDGVIELGEDGGFDISNATTSTSESASTPPSQPQDDSIPSESKTVSKNNTTSNIEPKEKKEVENVSQDKKDTKDKDGDDSPPPVGNGGTVDGKYVWTQTLSELTVTSPLPENTRGRDLNVSIKKKHLKIGLKSSNQIIVDAPLTKQIIVDDSFWTVEDGNRLVVSLQKMNQMEWWDAVCAGDPTIDVTKVQPENSKLDDLDGETRQTVEKMMFDQRQKAMGMPTSDEQRKFEMLEKFKKSHPEMDFSNAKIS